MARQSRHAVHITDLSEFPPTVCGHTFYKNGVRLHTIHRDRQDGPSTDIDIFYEENDER